MTLEQSISRGTALAQLGLAAVAAPAVLRGRYSAFTSATTEYSARCIKLIEENVVVDLLNQFRFEDFAEKPPRIDRWLTQPGRLERRRCRHLSRIEDDRSRAGPRAGIYEEAIRFFADWNGFLAGYSDWFTRIDDASDFARAKASNKLGIMITFQDSHHFRRPDDVNTFWGLGQRVSQLTYNMNNGIGSGFLEQRDGGLSLFGALDRRADESGRHGGGRVALRRPNDDGRDRGVEAAGDLHARELPRPGADVNEAQDG